MSTHTSTSGAAGGVRVTKSEVLRRYLVELIEDTLVPHDKLPTERNLAGEFSLSRLTVRQVLARLESEGRVYREQGSGTFVSAPRIAKSLELTSFSEDMKARGLRPGSSEIQLTRRAAGAEIGAALGISPRDEVLRFHRVRTADDIPICVEDSYIPSLLAPGIAETDIDGSLYELLSTRFHLKVDWAQQTIHATVLEPSEAAQLQCAEFGPAFDVTRVAFDARGDRIEYARSIYRGDRYSYDLTIYRT